MGNLPSQLGSCGGAAPPQLSTVDNFRLSTPNFRSFLFLFVFARELGALPKNSVPNPGSF